MHMLLRLLLLSFLATAFAPVSAGRSVRGAELSMSRFGYPIAVPGRLPGDGFFVRHGYAVENTWYLPGYLHTGEDWYAVEGDTAGVEVRAIAAGEVVSVGANYPGLVVIIRHAPDLFSMYGHLDPAVAVAEGDGVAQGDVIGTVLRRADAVPSHLHFEVRTFLTTPEVNGPAPRYGFNCGPGCLPGPGYWPIEAPDHPSVIGWRNPTHVIAQRAWTAEDLEGPESLGEVAVASQPSASDVAHWSQPGADSGARQTGRLALVPGDRYPLLEIRAGPEDASGTSAEAYDLWYRIALPNGESAWVQAAVPSTFETGSDGRPATVVFNLVPANDAST